MKCGRVTGSVLDTEMSEVAHAFDTAYTFSHSSGRLLDHREASYD